MAAPVIDFHAHVLEPEALKQCAPHSVATGFGARPMAPGTRVYGNDVLEALIQRVGADRVVLGTDYPFGEDDPVGNIGKGEGISAEAHRQILGETAAGILGL